MINRIMKYFYLGWERCDFPRWFRARKVYHKLGSNFYFKGKTFKYKAKYIGETDNSGSNEARFESSYKVYRKKRSMVKS
jgi:hypothetical protein